MQGRSRAGGRVCQRAMYLLPPWAHAVWSWLARGREEWAACTSTQAEAGWISSVSGVGWDGKVIAAPPHGNGLHGGALRNPSGCISSYHAGCGASSRVHQWAMGRQGQTTARQCRPGARGGAAAGRGPSHAGRRPAAASALGTAGGHSSWLPPNCWLPSAHQGAAAGWAPSTPSGRNDVQPVGAGVAVRAALGSQGQAGAARCARRAARPHVGARVDALKGIDGHVDLLHWGRQGGWVTLSKIKEPAGAQKAAQLGSAPALHGFWPPPST